jgi:cytoplasmic iron level regulating protein YaaA (DUF328/UPF0246 family)
MLVVVSPAKRLDWTARPDVPQTEPAFAAEAVALAAAARRLSKPKLRALMGISEDLAALNKARFAAFSDAPEAQATRPAMFAFAGDTYIGLDARSLDADARAWAEGHLRILSGLYGVLRPSDAIQPYRLEMGSRLKTRRGPDLYAFWGDRIARSLNDAAVAAGTGVLLNCASQEYFGAVDLSALGLRVVTPAFLEEKEDGPKIVSFFAKRARGAMARFVMERRLRRAEDLAAFDTGGYAFRPDLSEPDRPVFVRAAAAQAAA